MENKADLKDIAKAFFETGHVIGFGGPAAHICHDATGSCY
jgi:chromate transport protein ChrA